MKWSTLLRVQCMCTVSFQLKHRDAVTNRNSSVQHCVGSCVQRMHKLWKGKPSLHVRVCGMMNGAIQAEYNDRPAVIVFQRIAGIDRACGLSVRCQTTSSCRVQTLSYLDNVCLWPVVGDAATPWLGDAANSAIQLKSAI